MGTTRCSKINVTWVLHEVPKLYLTDSFVFQAKCPVKKSQLLCWDHPISLDGKVKSGAQKGLGFRVTSQGAKAYIHSVTFNGARRRMVIGDAANMNVSSARLLVQQRLSSLEDGIDPDIEKSFIVINTHYWSASWLWIILPAG